MGICCSCFDPCFPGGKVARGDEQETIPFEKAPQQQEHVITVERDTGTFIIINSAAHDKLLEVPAITEKIAEQIEDKRPFNSWDEFRDHVKGIGKVKLDIIRHSENVLLSESQIPRDMGSPSRGTDHDIKLDVGEDTNSQEQLIDSLEPLQLNSAEFDELILIKLITEPIAKEIISHRPFSDWQDLKKRVKGIGDVKLKELQEWKNPTVILDENIEKEPEEEEEEVNYDLDAPVKSIIEEAMPEEYREGVPLLSIAQWNIRHLSSKRAPQQLKKIANILMKFDIIAVQEIRDIEVCETLVKENMEEGWEFVISDIMYFGKNKNQKEYYAFFFNSSKIKSLSPPKLLESSFWRQPFVGYFRANSIDFVLCTIHIIWGDGSKDVTREVQKLDELVKEVDEYTGKEQDLILLGDFNRDYDSKTWQMCDMKPLVKRPNFSTFSEKNVGTHLYDQIWVKPVTEQLCEASGVHYFDQIMFGNSPQARKRANKEVSDHRPVWAVIRDVDLDDNLILKFDGLTLQDELLKKS